MVGTRLVAVVTAYAVLAAPLMANAQCKADVDCKGDRICEAGRCVDPRTMQPDPPPPQENEGVKVIIRDDVPPPEEYGTGWALPAGIIGLASAAGVLALSIGSALTVDREKDDLDPFGDPVRDPIPTVPLAVGATVLTAAMGPVVFVGGGSARRSAGATGLLGLRITGWVLYGVALLGALYVVLFNVADIVKPPPWLIIADGALGTASLTMFSIDALVAYAEADEGVISRGPAIAPALLWAKHSDGSSVPTLGLNARF